MNTIKNTSGVYRITNTENGKRYYGSSKELRQRWTNHKHHLRTGTQRNPGLREDAAVYGEEVFEFEVLCYCKPEESKRLEGVLIDQNLGEGCYNRQDSNGGFEHTEESKANISKAKKGKPAKNKGKSHPQRKATCPHCGLTGGAGNMKRYHFHNCKHKEVHNV